MAPTLGRLWLIPSPIGAATDAPDVLPRATLAVIATLGFFIVENARTARSFLREVPLARPLQELEMIEWNEHSHATDLPRALAPLLAGRDVGVLSEAGCPAVADPGADLVAAAHALGVEVCPLVGPSSLLLALMGSGLNGQRFSFAGYLPVESATRATAIAECERRSARNDETVLLIETPYRNQSVLDALLAHLRADTQVLVAIALTLPEQRIVMRHVQELRANRLQLPRTPTVFGLLAQRPLGTAKGSSKRHDQGAKRGPGTRGNARPKRGAA